MYHIVVEALLAQPGQHFISDYLERRDVLPGFRAGMKQVALDEQRHIGFGVKLLHDLAAEDPEVPAAVSELLRVVTPYSLAVFIPPNWDRSYTECFGFTLEEIYTEGARSLDQKLRAAGMPIESLPGPQVFPIDRTAAERAEYGLAMLRAGFIGPPNGTPPRDPAAMELLFSSVARAVDTRTAPPGPFTVQWDFEDAEPWHVVVNNGSTAAAAGRAPAVDLEVQCRYEDWVDIVAGRLDPKRALGHPPPEASRLAARVVGGALAVLAAGRAGKHVLTMLRLDEVEGRFRSLLAEAGVDPEHPCAADIERAWSAVREFGAETVEHATPPGGDGVLVQYGTYNWGDGEHFELDFTRQFTLSSGSMTQLSCTFHFEASDELRTLGAGDERALDDVPRGVRAVAEHGAEPVRLVVDYSDV